MALVIAEAVVTVSADGKAIPKKVADDVASNGAPMQGAGAGLAKTFLAGFGGILGGAAVLKGVDWFKGAITGASDMNETISKSSAIFGDQAAGLEKWSGRAALNLGLSQSAALNSAAGFGDMFTQIGFTGEAAASMSQDVVQAAADLGSFSNLDTADVADRMSAAFRGEYDSLQAVIPNINAARVESEALATTGKKTAAELTAQEKAAAVLAIVHKDGARAMGDFAKTSGGFANQQKIATASMADMQAEVGTALLPVMTGFMSLLLDNVIPALSDMAGWFTDNIEMIKQVAVVVGAMIAAFALLSIGVAIYSGIQSTLSAITLAGSISQWALNSAMFASPITWIIAGIALLVGALVLLVLNWDTVVKFVTEVWGGMLAWLEGVVDGFIGWWTSTWSAFSAWISALWSGITSSISTIWSGIVAWLTGAVGGIVSWIAAHWGLLLSFLIGPLGLAIQWIVTNWSGIMSWIRGSIDGFFGWWGGMWGSIGAALGAAWTGMVSAAGRGVDGVVGFVRGLPNTVIGFFSNAGSWLVSAGSNIMAGLTKGITDGIKGALSVIKDVGSNIVNTAKSVLGIHSPSTVMADEVGEQIPAGIEVGAVKGAKKMNAKIRGLVEVPEAPAQVAGVFGRQASSSSGTTISIGSVVLDAKNVKEFGDVVELIKALPQVARAGRGYEGKAA